MCLYTRQIMPIKARRDITCFKVVLALRSQDNVFLSPFHHMRMTIGEICDAVGQLMPRPICYQKLYCIADGYIHVFTDENQATEYCKKISTRCANFDCYVMECIIPKGTLYFVSAFRDYEGCTRSVLPIGLLAGYKQGCRKRRKK